MTTDDDATSRGNILIIDDTLENLRLLDRLLTDAGLRVRPASDGRMGLASARKEPPDLILLDIKMPGMDGWEVCERLKGDERTRDIPVIFITAMDDPADKVKGLTLGGVDYITKPFQEEEVLARVEKHLTIRDLQKQLEAKNTRLKREIAEHERTEAALRESEHRARALLNATTDAAVQFDREGIISDLNEAYARRFGKRAEELIGACIWDIFPGDVAEKRKRLTARVFQTGKPVRAEDQRQGLWNDYVIHPVPDTRGKTASVAVFAHDITDRKRVEEALRESEERYRALVEESYDVAYSVRLDGVITFLSPQMIRFGYTPGELISRQYMDFVAPEQRQAVVHSFEKGTADGTSHPTEFQWLCKDGSYRWVEVVGRSVYDESGRPALQVGVLRDIEQRKRAEEALQASEERLDLAMSVANDGMWDWNISTNEVYFDPRYYTVAGYEPDEFPGEFEEWAKRVHPDDIEYAEERIRAHLAGETAVFDIEFRFKRKDDAWMWIRGKGRIVARNERGKPLRMVGTHADITERKRAEEALRESEKKYHDLFNQSLRDIARLEKMQEEFQRAKEAAETANRAKSAFLANMSHELRTPLNAVLGYAQILQRDKRLDDDHLRKIGVIRGSGEHLLTLINHILDLSKIEAGKMELLPVDIHTPSFLEDVAGVIRARTREKGLDFTVETRALPEGIRADEVRLRQILLNLLSNAVKFTEKGGVTLEIDDRGFQIEDRGLKNDDLEESKTRMSHLKFKISDTGVGIAPGELDHVFLPFEQAGDAKGRAGGTGLGLSITRKLVNAMGGELLVDSAPGRGSVFRFEAAFPVVSAEAKEARRPREIVGYSGPGRKILVADDKPDNRMAQRDMLVQVGFEVILAENGREAAAKAVDARPDLILVDLVMPGMSGSEVARAIRTAPDPLETPIIAVSASVLESDRRDCRAAGCDAFLSKPVRARELYALLETHLDLTWTHAEPAADESAGRPRRGPMIPPPPGELAVLREMALIGDMSDIEERGTRIVSLGERYRPFGEKLRDLARDFAEKEILAFVERFIEQGDEK